MKSKTILQKNNQILQEDSKSLRARNEESKVTREREKARFIGREIKAASKNAPN